MKTITTFNGETWFLNPPILATKDEQRILKNDFMNLTDDEKNVLILQKKEIIDRIELSNKIDDSDLNMCISKYNENIPILSETDIFSLIASSITIDGDSVSGFINYKSNKEIFNKKF